MATKKSSNKKVVKKVPTKVTTKKVVRRTTPRKKSEGEMPGGKLMYVFLVVAALAAIVAIAGIILENQVEATENMKNYESFFTLIKQCRSAALGIFGIFLVLACFARMNKN